MGGDENGGDGMGVMGEGQGEVASKGCNGYTRRGWRGAL